MWFEFVARVVCSFSNHEHHLVLIFDVNECDAMVITSKGDSPINDRWSNNSMFVRIHQIMNIGQHLVFRPLRTVVRLKLFNRCVGSRVEESHVIPVEA